MFAFIKRHWLAYIIGAAVAVLIGLGASYFLGAKWSTPADVRAEHVKAEQKAQAEVDGIADKTDGGSSSGSR